MTGRCLLQGRDAVIAVERTELLETPSNGMSARIRLLDALATGHNARLAGTDVATDATLDIELDSVNSVMEEHDSEFQDRRLAELSQRANVVSERRRLSTRTDPTMAIVGRLDKPNSFEATGELAGQWLKEKHLPVSKQLARNFEILQPSKGHHGTQRLDSKQSAALH